MRRIDLRTIDAMKAGATTTKMVSDYAGMCIKRAEASLRYLKSLGYVAQNGNIWSLVEGVVP